MVQLSSGLEAEVGPYRRERWHEAYTEKTRGRNTACSLKSLKEHQRKRMIANMYMHIKRLLQRAVCQWHMGTIEAFHVSEMERRSSKAAKALKKQKKEAKQAQESVKQATRVHLNC